MLIGTTFSHRHCQYLQLDPLDSLEELLAMKFDILRIACYWDEIESTKGTYTFSAIQQILDLCEQSGQKVLLTVGMKAPRWPEYYFPKWLAGATPESAYPYVGAFLTASIKQLQSYQCITHWQVENEPLDPSGPNNYAISLDQLRKEVELVRSMDTRPIVVNLWGNELKKRKFLPEALQLADVVGLDLYYKVPLIAKLYLGPRDSDEKIKELVTESRKPIWITEVQAEPWERGNITSSITETPSMNERLLEENFKRVSSLVPEVVFLWGSEYWLMKKKRGDSRLVHVVKRLLT